MAQHRFYQDKKKTVWERTYFTIESPSKETAIITAAACARRAVPENDEEYSDEHGITIIANEILHETIEDITTISDPTSSVVIFGSDCDEIADSAITAWESWWSQTDFPTMERITGFRQSDFDPEDGYDDFVVACHDWWDALTAQQKVAIWLEE